MELANFNYGGQPVRTLVINGEPSFIAGDVCSVLDLTNVGQALANLDDDEKGSITIADGTPGNPTKAYVTEAGMYSLVLRSRKPEAKVFKRWITHEVLPQIRRTGSYQASPRMTGKELMAAALLEAQATLAEKDFQIEAQSRQLEAAAPKVAYIDQFVADSDLLTFRTVSASIGTGEQELRELLTLKKWIYVERDERWSNTENRKVKRNRYSAYADKKAYFQPVMNHTAPRFRNGEVMHTLKITPAGASAIARAVALKESA